MFMTNPDEKAIRYVSSLISLRRIDVAQKIVIALSKSQSLAPGTLEIIQGMVSSARAKSERR
jgi:hypothetical protein